MSDRDLIQLENKEDNEHDYEQINEDDDNEEPSTRRRSFIPQSVRRLGIPLLGMTKTARTGDGGETSNRTTENSAHVDSGNASPYSTMNVNFGIRKFDGTNWLSWKNQMLGYLVVKQCDVVLKSARPRDDIMAAAWDDRERFARGMLLCSMADKIVIMVAHLKTSKEI